MESGQRIRELRKTGGLAQEVLSEELNIRTDQLRKIECGSRGPSLDLLISLDFLPCVEYNKKQLEVANQRLPPYPVIQTFQEKEVQIERVSISSTDSR